MLGLGSSVSKSGKAGSSIVGDGLVLKHDYARGSVQPCSAGAASFDGTDDKIDLPSPFSYSTITVSAWVYVNSDTTHVKTIYEARDSSEDGFLFYVDTNERAIIKANGVAVNGTAGLALNKWNHFCFTYDSSNPSSQGIKLYENGVLLTPVSATGGTSSDPAISITANARIGGGVVTTTNYAFPGYICNVGIWDEVLTQAQVKSIMLKDYASLSDSEKTDLVSWWNLDSVIDSDIGTGVVVYDNHYAGGSEFGSELITNGSFSGVGAGWTTATGWTVTGGSGEWDTSADGDSNNKISQTITALVVGKVYKLTFTISNSDGGRQLVRLTVPTVSTQDVTEQHFPAGDGSTMGYGTYANGEHTIYFTATIASTDFSFHANHEYSSFNVDDISLKLVNGNTGTLA